mmetsp:Transcript_12157/g.16795  ORF Transcript_12157/g.16795 Transcript_12157/m.16795 type:complete len:291 (+) Transcript_12157:3-875(+)|eukprot:jgi/Bigna1/73451/fgenesh1_pg.24_\
MALGCLAQGHAALLLLLPSVLGLRVGSKLGSKSQAPVEPSLASDYDFIMGNAQEQTFSKEALLEDIALAHQYQKKSDALWGTLDQESFKNYVLPYQVATEAPSKWRAEFHEKFWPEVKDKSKKEAVRFLNRAAFSYLNVSYKADYPGHKPDQNPSESRDLHYASCTGLSIILVSACRSVGVPARLAMTPAWVTTSQPEEGKNGLSAKDQNHSWVEVFVDGKWHYVGASEDTALDKTWFTAQASKAKRRSEGDYKHSIYAVTYAKSDDTLPAPWDESKTVNVIEVVDRYSK